MAKDKTDPKSAPPTDAKSGLASRHAAYEILRSVGSGRHLDDALRLADDQPQRERAFIRMLVTTVLRRRGQIDNILDDLGPCPSANEPNAACLWLAALLNPLPALGVAPEIRPKMLLADNWHQRFELLVSAVDASLDVVRAPCANPRPDEEDDKKDDEEEIDVCRVS